VSGQNVCGAVRGQNDEFYCLGVCFLEVSGYTVGADFYFSNVPARIIASVAIAITGVAALSFPGWQ